MKTQKLWTYDFTVITLGSVVSMVGSTLSGFAISLLVLDYTGSTFLYMLFIVSYQLPMLVCPILAGPYLDRMSRKKVIYRLDFLSSGMFLLLFLLLLRDLIGRSHSHTFDQAVSVQTAGKTAVTSDTTAC